MDTQRTKEELDDLKAQWLADPCWDLYDTEDFQFHRDELFTFQEKQEQLWSEEEQARVAEKCSRLGINRVMLLYIESLEDKIRRLEKTG